MNAKQRRKRRRKYTHWLFSKDPPVLLVEAATSLSSRQVTPKGLTKGDEAVLASLRKAVERDLGDGWGAVYLDNARSDGMSRYEFAGHLSSLKKAGLYRPLDSEGFFGDVLLQKERA